MRKSLYALFVGTTLLSCAKKSSDDAAIEAIQAESPPSPTERTGENSGGGATGASDKSEAAPGAKVAMGSAAAAPATVAMDDGLADPTAEPARAKLQTGAAGVRAGEWDDNANYRDYVKWIKESPRNVARLDVSDRQFLVVKDKNGKPVPNCTISIDAGDTKVSLVTMASGRALWFPHAYGAGAKASATAHCGQDSIATQVNGQLDTVTQFVLSSSRDLPKRRTIDLAFVLDTTGSMSEEIDAVKQTIRTVADQLSTEQTDVRIGLVEYKDRGDELVTRTYAFSSDLGAFARKIDGIAASGGGDMPEDMQKGVSDAIDKLQWRRDAVSRMVVVIADAPPHLDYQDEKTFADSAKLAASRGIKLFTVSASGMDDTGQIVMRQMAQFTGASNMFVLRGGAGPQSVGGGDPKSSCGGTQEQYASGKLDKLIVNKVRQELAAVDADPMRIAGLGKDESAKPCNERIVMAY